MSFKALFLAFSLAFATPVAQAEMSITHTGELYFELGNDGILKAKDLCRKRTVVVMEGVKEQHIINNQVFAVDQSDTLHYVAEFMTKVPRSHSRKIDEVRFAGVTGLFSFAVMSANAPTVSLPAAAAVACATYVSFANSGRQLEVQTNTIEKWLHARGVKEHVESFEIKKEGGVTTDIVLITDKGVHLVSELSQEPTCESQLAWRYPY